MARFMLITSLGCGDSKAAPPPNVYTALEPVLKAKEKVCAWRRKGGEGGGEGERENLGPVFKATV